MRAELTTQYLGLRLRNPVVASAGPLTGDLDSLRQLEQAGISAAVLPSLFEEQITREQSEIHALYEHQSFSFAESLSYFPELKDYNVGPREYLRLLQAAKTAVQIPILGSLNGCSPGGWIRYAKAIEEAGADALELNVYLVPTDPQMTALDVEDQYVDLVLSVRDAVSIPLAVKLGAHFSSLPNFAQRLAQARVDGLVLFNRYLEPDLDLHTLQITPQLVLSNRHELRSPLRWIAILRDQLSISLAATSGVHFSEDVVKLLLVGADVVMITSALLKHGADYVEELVEELQNWLDTNEYQSVEQMKGSMSYGNCPDSGALERANYMKAITSYTAVK